MKKILLYGAMAVLLLHGPAQSLEEKGIKASPAITVLAGATLIDGLGAAPVPDSVVVIEGNRIKAAGPARFVKIPPGARTIQVKGKYILPGFIDCHIHITFPYDELQALTDTRSIAALRGLDTMNKYLRSGVTAVRDVGAPLESMQALLRGQELGYIDSIRLVPCGNLITVTGGHGDGTEIGYAADGPWEWRKAVRQMHKSGFRYVKISPTYTFEEAKAAVEEARTLGMGITVHGGGASDTTPTTMTKIAVEAGVSCIEHLNEMEDNVLDLIAQKGVFIVPTLSVYRESYRTNSISPDLINKRHWTMEMHEALFRKARERKIIMGIGTDGVEKFMRLYPEIFFLEMKYFVELGASPMEAIVAATRSGALILGRSDEIGTIEAGKLADLQVLGSDPLVSFNSLGKPEIVIVNGKIHRFGE